MKTLSIHPAQEEWLNAVAQGKKILWHGSMHTLHCFLPEFDPRKEEYVMRHVLPTPLHDLAYPLYDQKRGAVGVAFWSLGWLLKETDLLSTQDECGHITPLAIYEHGSRAYEATAEYRAIQNEKKARVLAQDKEAILFLKQYPLRVPYSTWSRALPMPDS